MAVVITWIVSPTNTLNSFAVAVFPNRRADIFLDYTHRHIHVDTALTRWTVRRSPSFYIFLDLHCGNGPTQSIRHLRIYVYAWLNPLLTTLDYDGQDRDIISISIRLTIKIVTPLLTNATEFLLKRINNGIFYLTLAFRSKMLVVAWQHHELLLNISHWLLWKHICNKNWRIED